MNLVEFLNANDTFRLQNGLQFFKNKRKKEMNKFIYIYRKTILNSKYEIFLWILLVLKYNNNVLKTISIIMFFFHLFNLFC